jgi:hypothetical protein
MNPKDAKKKMAREDALRLMVCLAYLDRVIESTDDYAFIEFNGETFPEKGIIKEIRKRVVAWREPL